ncbi:rCG28486 [Rattus norvegicus]|uniref:RCG28486 n=1 Tax=Rattus norvegicus TaxID=10116 RepID=A6HVM3_RAT|nr:rCG28486 [Rattus norvegicus]
MAQLNSIHFPNPCSSKRQCGQACRSTNFCRNYFSVAVKRHHDQDNVHKKRYIRGSCTTENSHLIHT